MFVKYFSQVFIALIAASLFYQNAIAINQSPRVESYPVLKPGARFSYVDGIASLKCNQWEIQEVKDKKKLETILSNNIKKSEFLFQKELTATTKKYLQNI